MSSVFWAQVNTRVLSAETLQSGAAVDWHINLHTIFQVRDAVGEPQNHPTVCRTGDHPEEYSTCAFSEGRLRSAVIWQLSIQTLDCKRAILSSSFFPLTWNRATWFDYVVRRAE